MALYKDAIQVEKPGCKHGGRTDAERIFNDVRRCPRLKQEAPFDVVDDHFKAVQLCKGDDDQPLYNKIGDLRAQPTEVATVWMLCYKLDPLRHV